MFKASSKMTEESLQKGFLENYISNTAASVSSFQLTKM